MTIKLTKEIIETALTEANEAAIQATREYLQSNHHRFPCGFSWVIIRPARGVVVKYLKDNNIGHKGYDGGWKIWNPSQSSTQSMYALYTGSLAFADVLKDKLGIIIEAECWID